MPRLFPSTASALIVFISVLRADDGSLVHDSIIDPLAHHFPRVSYSVPTVHGVTFQQDGVTTYKGWQYATYYQGNLANSSGKVAVARRPLPDGAWERLVLDDYIFSTVDSHNDVVLGICPGDGSIHLSFDHHGDDLNYRVSIPGVADHPETTAWTPALFGPVTDRLAGPAKMTAVTYPRFIPTPAGRLLFTYRFGGSGGGDEILYEYDGASGVWTLIGQYTTRSGSYTGTFASGTDRNAYFDNTLFDSSGRLHATWCWRETPDASSNHDLLYAYSDDVGRTWKNQLGNTIAVTGSSFISVNSPGITGWPIAQRRNYINNSAMTVDADGRVHVVAWHLPAAEPDQNFTTSLASKARFIHYWRGSDGTWRQNETSLTGTRAKLAADDDGRVFLVYGDASNIRIAAANPSMNPELDPAGSWSDWALLDLSGALPAGRANSVNIITDTARWEADRIISVYAQETNISGTAPTPLHVLDYHVSRAAVLPEPCDGAADAALAPVLSWTAGQNAVAHDVYFGSSEMAVASAGPSSPEYRGRQASNTHAIPVLPEEALRYWRVDSVDASGQVTSGRVWSFQTDTLDPAIQQGAATRGYGGRVLFPVTLDFKDPALSSGDLRLFFGETDGGTDPAAWASTVDIESAGSGAQVLTVDSLPEGALYFRFRISTIHGTSWAAASGMLGPVDDLSRWTHSALLEVNGVAPGETLQDFPVLVRLSPDSVSGFSYAQMLSPPHGDLRFSTSDGQQLLAHEVESWSPAGTSWIWVRVPELTAGTRIRLWWGKSGVSAPPSAPTWSSFNGVWHLDETLGFGKDSSASNIGNALNTTGSSAAVVAGAASFNGTSAAVAIDNSSALSPSLITVEAWVRTTVGTGTQSIFSKDQTNSSTLRVWQFRLNAGKPEFLPFSTSAVATAASPDAVNDGQFHHLCGTWDGTTVRIYVDGILKGSTALSGTLRANQSNRAFIGRSENLSPNYFNGTIDEVRLSPGPRSAAWVKASFDSQKPGSDFLTTGPALSPDMDGDHLSDLWEMRHFGTIHGDDLDRDGDGAPDLLEFAMGTDPASGDEAPAVQVMAGAPAEFTFRQISGGNGNVGTTYSAAGLVYRVEVSDDLVNWQSGPSVVVASGRREALDDGFELVGVHVLGPQPGPPEPVFVRLRVEPQE